MLTEEDRDFLNAHRLVVLGFNRTAGPPHMSPVYYVMDGDDFLISTTASRLKAKAVRRNPEVSLCVLAEEMPFPYRLIYGRGQIEEQDVVGVMRRIGEQMAGGPLPDSVLTTLEERAKKEGRVVLRVTPDAVRSTAPIGQRRA